MGKLTSSQKKGKKCSYTNRFLKKQFAFSRFPENLDTLTDYKVQELTTQKNCNSVVMCLRSPHKSEKLYYVAPLGTKEGDTLHKDIVISELRNLDIGTSVFYVENYRSSKGHKFRSAETYGKVLSKTETEVTIQKDGRYITCKANCRAIVGIPGNGDIKLKPLGKAGSAYKKFHAKGKKYSRVSGNAKNIVDCPGGGSYKKKRGITMCVSRNAPPGRKYGHIAPKRTGKK